jgi:Flp pilus assembly protein CpaB
MRRGRIFIYLALIIILGLVAAFVFYQRYTQPSTDEGQLAAEVVVQEVEQIDVVVVTQATPRGTILDETILTTIQIPKNDYIEGMFFSEMSQVVGRRAKFDLDSGIPLTASMLVESVEQLSATGSIAALSIPRGKVAVSIPISRLSSVSYAPKPGDNVSVIVTLMFIDIDSEFQTKLQNQAAGVLGPGAGVVVGSGTGETAATEIDPSEFINNITVRITGGGAFSLQGRTELDPILNELVYVIPSEPQRGRLVSQTLLPSVMVLQVGDFAWEEEKDTQANVVPQDDATQLVEPAPTEGEVVIPEGPKPPDVITLVVSPQDAVTLNYLIFSGAQLTLALRGTGDDTIELTEAATLQFLLDQYNISVPAKLPYGLEPRINDLVPPVLLNDIEPVEQPQ